MGFFNAFKGSKPAIDNDKILIVRGKSRQIYPPDQLKEKLEEIGEKLGGRDITNNAKQVDEILKAGDKQIQSEEEMDAPIDKNGFSRMKDELESMGLVVEYRVFELLKYNVVIAIWEDKNPIPPLYVEVTVSEKE